MATSGIFWQYLVVQKHQVPHLDPKAMKIKADSRNESKTQKFLDPQQWSLVFEIGTEDSDSEFTKLRDNYFHPFVVAEERRNTRMSFV